jgi:uncharacterized protein (DUF1800 family)
MSKTTAVVVLGLVVGLATVPAAGPVPDREAVTHVLNRIGFGPRPGDIEKVQALGIERYIDQQLHPERIADPAMDARLSSLTTLTLSSKQISEQFEQPLIQARRAQREAQRDQPAANGTPDPQMARPRPGGPQQAANTVVLELSEQKLLRAIHSERQLQEVLVDFWFNHFNVDARKGRVRFMLTEYERDAIRPHVLGRFRDLLGATAKSPAMLFYLDNFMSADPDGSGMARQTARPGRPGGLRPTQLMPPQAQNRMPRGLNENYGRELMELHTLGVDGGYTQKDVTEVARAFTGWTIGNPRSSGARGAGAIGSRSGFFFNPRLHDDGEKVVMGHRIKSGGDVSDGEQVLDLLAAHPSTARFIATKLSRRFVSDTPPAALVDRVAASFTESKGDLREVMRSLLSSPEFLAPATARAKVKTPFEFLVSALRATDATVTNARPLVRTMQDLGMPLYQCQPPTGYKDTAEAWASTGAIVNRMNVAQALGAGRLGGTSVDLAEQTALDGLVPGLSEATRTTIARGNDAAGRLTLTLGSPEFQRR